MSKRRQNLQPAGMTLVEVLVAAVILSGVIVSLTLFAPRAMKSIVRVQTRSAATSVATTQIEQAKSHPYAIIPVTPDGHTTPDYFVVSDTGPCDCSNVNFAQGIPTSSQTVNIGGNQYTYQTCVNYVQNTPTGWHSNCTNDTGLKQIVTNVSWSIGNEVQSYTMRSLVSAPSHFTAPVASTASFTITVYQADGSLPPPGADTTNLLPVHTAEVSVSNGSFLAENNHTLDATNTTTLYVSPGSGYQIHVQMAGFFPYYSPPPTYNVITGQAVGPITVILRDAARYGSKLTGEAFAADHPVISKIIDGYSQPHQCAPPSSPPVPNYCDNATEALEIYNPTSSTFTVGPAGAYPQLTIQFCNSSTCWPNAGGGTNFVDPHFAFHNGTNATLYPGSYLLIVGKDTRAGGSGIPAEWGAAAATPDITYDVRVIPTGDTTGIGLIP